MQRESKIFLFSYFLISIGTPGQFLYAIKKADPITGALMVSIYSITMAISSFCFSRLSDRYMKRKIFAIIGFSIFTLVFIAYYFFSSPFALILCSSLVGMGFAAYSPTSNALFSEMEPTIPGGKLMSYFFVVASAGWAFGTLIGGFINQYFGDFIFIFTASVTLLGLVFYLLKVQDVPFDQIETEEIIESEKRSINSNLNLYSVLITILVVSVLMRHLCVQGGFSLFPNYLEAGYSEGGLNLDPLTISLLLGVNMATQSCIMIPIGHLVDHRKFGRKIVLLIGIIGSNLAILIWSLIKISWLLIFPQLLIGFSWPALATAATAFITDITTRRTRSQGMGWFNTGLAIGGSIGPLIAGLLFAQSGGTFILVFQILSIFPIVSIILILVSFSENRTTHQYFLFRRKKIVKSKNSK